MTTAMWPNQRAAANRRPAGQSDGSERVRKMGSTGDPPVPVGDPPTGRARRLPAKDPPLLAPGALPIPPGESPGGTGQWPVLPGREFPDALSGKFPRDRCRQSASPAALAELGV